MPTAIPYRVSGHESFTCRYTWLPKVVHHLKRDDRLFSNEERAMVKLGVGKNMVRSIRFWAQSTGILATQARDGRYHLTRFATLLLGDRGLDRYLEDTRTLWLVHWKLATNIDAPLLAWDYLLNRWQEPEIAASTVIKVLHRETFKQGDKLSITTLVQHFDTFLHTYVPTRGRKGIIQEDNLDCPLVELEFILKVGEREIDASTNKREAIYAFRREEKPDITPELFIYALNSFWQSRHPSEATLSLREVAHGHGGPGQVFKLPEEDVRTRLEGLNHSQSPFSYSESISLQRVRRRQDCDEIKLLKAVY